MLKAYGGVDTYLHEFFTFLLHGKRLIILTFRLLFLLGNRPLCILDRWMDGTQSPAWRGSQKKNQCSRRELKSVASHCPDRVILLYYAETAKLATLWNSISRTAAATLLTSWYGSPTCTMSIAKRPTKVGKSQWSYISIPILSAPTARSEDPREWRQGRSAQGYDTDKMNKTHKWGGGRWETEMLIHHQSSYFIQITPTCDDFTRPSVLLSRS